MKFKFAEHIVRDGSDKWTPLAKKRERWRPKCRWEDELVKRVGIL